MFQAKNQILKISRLPKQRRPEIYKNRSLDTNSPRNGMGFIWAEPSDPAYPGEPVVAQYIIINDGDFE